MLAARMTSKLSTLRGIGEPPKIGVITSRESLISVQASEPRMAHRWGAGRLGALGGQVFTVSLTRWLLLRTHACAVFRPIHGRDGGPLLELVEEGVEEGDAGRGPGLEELGGGARIAWKRGRRLEEATLQVEDEVEVTVGIVQDLADVLAELALGGIGPLVGEGQKAGDDGKERSRIVISSGVDDPALRAVEPADRGCFFGGVVDIRGVELVLDLEDGVYGLREHIGVLVLGEKDGRVLWVVDDEIEGVATGAAAVDDDPPANGVAPRQVLLEDAEPEQLALVTLDPSMGEMTPFAELGDEPVVDAVDTVREIEGGHDRGEGFYHEVAGRGRIDPATLQFRPLVAVVQRSDARWWAWPNGGGGCEKIISGAGDRNGRFSDAGVERGWRLEMAEGVVDWTGQRDGPVRD